MYACLTLLASHATFLAACVGLHSVIDLTQRSYITAKSEISENFEGISDFCNIHSEIRILDARGCF